MNPPADAKEKALVSIGHDLVGPCALAFAGFIASKLQHKPVNAVLFGARDTYLVKEAFVRLTPKVSSTYFRISRRALYLAEYAITGNPRHFFEGRIDAKDFFERLGVPSRHELSGLDPRQNREVFLDAARKSGLDEIAGRELDLVRAYLHEVGFVGQVAFVDLGWRGNLHDAISRIVGPGCHIDGYYFGIIPDAKDKHGYYFSGKRPWNRYSRLAQAIPPFEFVFTEPAASLRRLVPTESGFSFEFIDDESPEQIASRHRIAEGCLRYFSERIPNLPVDSFGWASKMLRDIDSTIYAHLLDPVPSIVEALAAMSHSHSFGGTHRSQLCSTADFNLIGYANATWRAGYVRASKRGSSLAWKAHRALASPVGMALVSLLQEIVRLWRKMRTR